MNCNAIERLILESEERHLEQGERRRVEEHLRVCPGCRAFEGGRRVVREGVEELRREWLPRSLDLRTGNLCLEALGAGAAEGAAEAVRTKVPLAVTAVSLLFTGLAVIWLTVTLLDVTPGQPLPSSAWAAIVFIAQNALMLFLSPVILRPPRTSER
jgi:hypothetical protein